jgi:hypothetical protein
MHHVDTIEPAPNQRPPSAHGMNHYRPPSHIRRDGASMRMVAAMAEPFLPGGRSLFEDGGAIGRLTPFADEARESDAQYFLRRSDEERRATGEAMGPEARAAHRDLADRYARLSRRATRPDDARFQGNSGAHARIAEQLGERFGRSSGRPRRLWAADASRATRGTPALSRL